MTTEIKLTWDERQALPIIRAAIRRNPAVINVLMEDMARGHASAVLVQASKDLKQLLEVTQAFAAVAAVMAKQEAADKLNKTPV